MGRVILSDGQCAEYRASKLCLVCFNKKRRNAKNKEKHNKQLREWRRKNADKCRKRENEYYQKNAEKINQKRRERYSTNNELRKANVERVSNYRKKNPFYKINCHFSNAIRRSIKDKKGSSVFSLLGYSLEDLMNRLESQFTDGMSWENHGEWHIDHIKPVCSFNFSSREDEDFKKCWALDNLRPLWARENLKKSAQDKLFKSPLNKTNQEYA